MNVDVVGREFGCQLQFAEGIRLAISFSVDNSEIEVRKRRRGIHSHCFFEQSLCFSQMVHLDFGVGKIERGLEMVGIVGELSPKFAGGLG